jgi:predicted negative regulator of RcsB-dependent stress response
MLRRQSVQELFNGYYFDYNLAALQQAQGFINGGNELIKTAKKNAFAPLKGSLPGEGISSAGRSVNSSFVANSHHLTNATSKNGSLN